MVRSLADRTFQPRSEVSEARLKDIERDRAVADAELRQQEDGRRREEDALTDEVAASMTFAMLGLGLAKLAKLAKFCKILAGSFSAVSKRKFARKYAFVSIFQALQDVHTFLHRCNLKILAKNRFEKSAIKFFVKIQQN